MTNSEINGLLDEALTARRELQATLAFYDRKIKILRSFFRNEGMEMQRRGIKSMGHRARSKEEALGRVI